ncbi:MAG TPA: 1-acyl-sn-glycerol-3-phosphate acyltransferase [Beijerinckiaceae bacterium]|nr:1-acyl-sn-glycerol-3-phosphate acyltransferase [Beijerinckiaceae bacterium]
MREVEAKSLKQKIALGLLHAFGWKVIARDVPDKCVIIGYSHTSNWDFLFFVLARMAYGMNLSYLAKAEIFRFGAGPVLKALGGIPVDRSAAQGVVGEAVAMFGRMPELRLAISPEGTRKRTEYFKSGFYHIAIGAGVPLLLAALDFGTRTIDIGPAIALTGDAKADMNAIRARYEGVRGYHPEKMGVLRMRDEDAG